MSRVVQVTLKVLNDPGDKGEFEEDQDIEAQSVYCSYEDTTQDWELTQEINELTEAIDKLMGAGR
jgi:hypothetical protein